MRVVFTNFGTIGDFRPLMLLAKELAASGHTPVLAFPELADALSSQTKFECVRLGPDMTALRDHVNEKWAEEEGIHQSSERMTGLLMPFQASFDQIFTELNHACRNADVLISGPAQPLARMVHEKTGIPFVSIQLCHFGGHGGRALREAGDRLVNPFRKKLGLPPLRDPLTLGANSPQLALYAMSVHVRPQLAEWPRHYHLTGFFFEKDNSLWEMDPDLEQFISEGSSPVVITLGSMVHRDPKKIAGLLAEAVEMAGCRAVIQGTSRNDIPPNTTRDIYWAAFVPHQHLFPKAACVVLHGGVGTAAAVFRAGVPGIFVPHGDCYDQRYWAELSAGAGCSVPAIPYLKLTSRKLASAIQATLNNDGLRRAATALGAKIRKEPGTRLAVRLVTELVARIGLQPESA